MSRRQGDTEAWRAAAESYQDADEVEAECVRCGDTFQINEWALYEIPDDKVYCDDCRYYP